MTILLTFTRNLPKLFIFDWESVTSYCQTCDVLGENYSVDNLLNDGLSCTKRAHS